MDRGKDTQREEESQDKADNFDEDKKNEEEGSGTGSDTCVLEKNGCDDPTCSEAEGAVSKEESETDDDEVSSVESVRQIKRPNIVITLEGSHTDSTSTDAMEPFELEEPMPKQAAFENVIEELLHMPPLSSSTVVGNVRQYVLQIESASNDQKKFDKEMQSNAIEAVEQREESKELMVEERLAEEELERIVAEHFEPEVVTDVNLQQVERENQEMIQRYNLIMEMFDSFSKNLAKLTMSTATEELRAAPSGVPMRHSPSIKKSATDECADVTSLVTGKNGGGSVNNELYLELHGERCILNYAEDAPKTKESTTLKIEQKPEDAPGPMCRDIATTMSGLHLLQPQPLIHLQRQSTIACQTAHLEIARGYMQLPVSRTLLPSIPENECAAIPPDGLPCLPNATEKLTDTVTMLEVAERGTGLVAPTDNTNGILQNQATNDENVAIIEVNAKKVDDSADLLKIKDTPTIIDMAPVTSAPHVTAVVADGNVVGGSAPCERTFHTIHIEATSSPSSSVMHRPPLCSRLWNVITDFCAAVCLCLQVNKDCLFCFGFVISFVLSASFLTSFAYRTLSTNSQLFQLPPAQADLDQSLVAVLSFEGDNII